MSLNRGVLAAGILIVSGFCSGFVLSNGSGQVFGMKPVHSPGGTTGGGSNFDEEAAVAIMKAGAGDDDGENSGHHPTLATSEGGAGPGDKLAAAAGDLAEPTDHAVKATGPVLLAGAVASASLAGNTIDASLPNGPRHLTYYAPRGLSADGTVGRMIVRPWNRKSASLCAPGSDGVAVCRPLRVRLDGGDHAEGAKIGTLLVAGERWVPVYKGNLLQMPDHIPAIDSVVADAEPSDAPNKPTAKGQAAVDALIGHAATVDRMQGSGDQSRTVVYFSGDGRRVIVNGTTDAADPFAGVVVSVGRWTSSKGILCQTDGIPDALPTCSKPEAWGKGSVRLLPTKGSTDIRLNVLVETPKPQTEAAN